MNDYSAVVITGEEMPDYLTDRKRRGYLHPELQAELEFGIEQSTGVDAKTLLENFQIFLDHDAEWEDANESILEARANAAQSAFPAMDQLAEAVPHEIAYQAAMWKSDYAVALEAAREVLSELKDPGLRGYRALWHYLAGSAAELGVQDGDAGLEKHAREHFQRAKDSAIGIPWLVALARRHGMTPSREEQQNPTITLQIERLEARLSKLGMLHNRDYSAQEREIREGLRTLTHLNRHRFS